MGLRTASWVSPLGGIALALAIVYTCGLRLSFRLSQRIVAVIDGLSHAAHRIGKGDFSVRIAVPKYDQLGILAASFNAMTRDLENLREQEKVRAVLEGTAVPLSSCRAGSIHGKRLGGNDACSYREWRPL
jgi:nitrate/nitrite-specific signal transduction histidine kinase